MWEVITEYISDWLDTLDEKTVTGIFGAIEVLQQAGPALKRPLVGEVVGSRHKGMKELRPGSSRKSEIRILFIFDPKRQAVLLLGGDKHGEWDKWYKTAIPQADEIYDTYLSSLTKPDAFSEESKNEKATNG